VKKPVIGLLLALAVIVIVSPGIIGRLAEEQIDESLSLAADSSNGVLISSLGFDRGWFSSAGQHRVELVGGIANGRWAPALIIDTQLDHGLIPLSSMRREQGSLAPGLGSAVSTLALDLGDGETVDLPGAIYSKIGITGDLQARFVLPAGEYSIPAGVMRSEPGRFAFSSDSSASHFVFSGDIGTVVFTDGDRSISIAGLTFSGDQRLTEYGVTVGDFELDLGELSTTHNGMSTTDMRGLEVAVSSSEVDGIIEGTTTLLVDGQHVPDFGEVAVAADIAFSGVDAAALGNLMRRVDKMDENGSPEQLFAATQDELARLFAAGFHLDLQQLDVTLPMGKVAIVLNVEVPGTDLADFEWTGLLLSTVAAVDIEVPAELVDIALQMMPQADMAIGLGYVKKNGDVYTTRARLTQGRLTVNGAPVPLPLGAYR